MEAPTHTLPDEMLVAYSAGRLPEPFALVVAAHVSLCVDSRVRLEAFEAVGGVLLEQGPVANMAADSFMATMERIHSRAKAPIRAPATYDGVLPAPVTQYVGGDIDAVRWRAVGMGVKQSVLAEEGSSKVKLIVIPGGTGMPQHGHDGSELTLVLKGAYRDGETEYRRGDVELADQSVRHMPVALDGEDCVCLSATDARLRFTSLLPRLAQTFLRI